MLMDGIKIPITRFKSYIEFTGDEIWYGILKRDYWDQKHTASEWFSIINTLKSLPAK